MPELHPVYAVRNGGQDFLLVPTQDELWVAALLRDRESCVAQGRIEDVAAINAELARLGYTEE